MGFKTEKVSVKDIVQRELAEIDAFLFEDGEIVKYEIALESIPEKIRRYARENQVIYGFEEEQNKISFMKKEDFIKKFSATYCANHSENVKEQTIETEMFAYYARKRTKRFILPLVLMLIVLFASAIGFGTAYIRAASKAENGTRNTISQLENQLKSVTAEKDQIKTKAQELEQENAELKSMTESLTEENEALSEEAEQWRANKDRINWYNANAVVVYRDGADLYHRYGCTRHQDVDYGIYDKARARSNGYLPCPHCLGE